MTLLLLIFLQLGVLSSGARPSEEASTDLSKRGALSVAASGHLQEQRNKTSAAPAMGQTLSQGDRDDARAPGGSPDPDEGEGQKDEDEHEGQADANPDASEAGGPAKKKKTFAQRVHCWFTRKCQEEPPGLKTYRVENTENWSRAKGLAYRRDKKEKDKDLNQVIPWGKVIAGTDEADGKWVKVDISDPTTGTTEQVRYLPKEISGKPVLIHDADAEYDPYALPQGSWVEPEEVSDTDNGGVDDGHDTPEREEDVPIPPPRPEPGLDDFIGKEKADETNEPHPASSIKYFTGFDAVHKKRYGLHDKSKFMHEHALDLAAKAGANFKSINAVHEQVEKAVGQLQEFQKKADDARIASREESRDVSTQSLNGFEKLANFHQQRGPAGGIDEHYDVHDLEEEKLLRAGKEEKEKGTFDFWSGLDAKGFPSQYPRVTLEALGRPQNHSLFSRKGELQATVEGDVNEVGENGHTADSGLSHGDETEDTDGGARDGPEGAPEDAEGEDEE